MPDSPRRIAYLCLQATTEGQASYAHVHEIIRGLRELGWEVDLFEPAYAGSQAPGIVGRLAEFRRVFRRLARALDSYDALYVRSHAFALPAVRNAVRRGVPLILECNGGHDDLYQAWPAARPLARLVDAASEWQYRHADRTIAVTPELGEWLRAMTGRAATVVPNGANTDIFTPDAHGRPDLPERYAVFFGAFAPWQGISTALDAVRQPEWPAEVSLVVVGDGAERPAVEASVAAGDPVLYLGRLPYAEVAGVVAGAVASLIPKNQPDRGAQGLAPLKLFESLSCGTPVVVSRTGGMDTLVDAWRCGLSFPAGDAVALARSVSTLASDPETARVMGARGREHVVAEASWRVRAHETARVIEDAIAARGAGR